MKDIDHIKLRTAFIVYGAMNRKDWRTISIDDVNFETAELSRQLIPTLRIPLSGNLASIEQYGNQLLEECRQSLSTVLPFTEPERTFLDLLLDHGEIKATILTDNTTLQQCIQKQPLLEWKAVNVRKHKGL